MAAYQKNNPAQTKRIVIISGLIGLILVLGIVFFIYVQRLPGTSQSVSKPTLPPFPSVSVVPGELVIKYREGFSPDSLTPEAKTALLERLAQVGVTSEEKMFPASTDPSLSRFYILHLNPQTNLEQATKRIYSFEEVEHVGPNVVYQAF